MITNQMRILDTLEKLEQEVYTYYPTLLKSSIQYINSYINHLKDKIFSINSALKKNVFPAKYHKWVIIYSFNENDLRSAVDNTFKVDGKNVFSKRYDPLYDYDELKNCLSSAQYWLSKWEEIKSVISERLQMFDKIYPLAQPQKIPVKEQMPAPSILDNNSSAYNLRKPNSGELKELCSSFADDLKLANGKTVKNESIQIIYERIIKEKGIQTTVTSVASTLRKLGFCKKNGY